MLKGQKYWSLFSFTARNLARVICECIFLKREGEFAKENLLAKMYAYLQHISFSTMLTSALQNSDQPNICFRDHAQTPSALRTLRALRRPAEPCRPSHTFAKAADDADATNPIMKSP